MPGCLTSTTVNIIPFVNALRRIHFFPLLCLPRVCLCKKHEIRGRPIYIRPHYVSSQRVFDCLCRDRCSSLFSFCSHFPSSHFCFRSSESVTADGSTVLMSYLRQYLEEDPRTNRIHDSLQLFTSTCSNKLLKNSSMVLMLNKVGDTGC
jgi:G-protein alpha subunit